LKGRSVANVLYSLLSACAEIRLALDFSMVEVRNETLDAKDNSNF
jgi:hypothetical protein